MGPVLLSDVLNTHSGVIALLVAMMAVGVYWLVEQVEQRFGDSDSLPRGSKRAKRTAAAVLVLLGLILAVINPDRIAAERAASLPEKPPESKASVHPTAPEKEKPASPGFQIVEDEGC
jgi:hypothetical protein